MTKSHGKNRLGYMVPRCDGHKLWTLYLLLDTKSWVALLLGEEKRRRRRRKVRIGAMVAGAGRYAFDSSNNKQPTTISISINDVSNIQ